MLLDNPAPNPRRRYFLRFVINNLLDILSQALSQNNYIPQTPRGHCEGP